MLAVCQVIAAPFASMVLYLDVSCPDSRLAPFYNRDAKTDSHVIIFQPIESITYLKMRTEPMTSSLTLFTLLFKAVHLTSTEKIPQRVLLPNLALPFIFEIDEVARIFFCLLLKHYLSGSKVPTSLYMSR